MQLMQKCTGAPQNEGQTACVSLDLYQALKAVVVLHGAQAELPDGVALRSRVEIEGFRVGARRGPI